MVLLIRVRVLGNRLFFDIVRGRFRVIGVPPSPSLPIASGLRVVLQVCGGEEGFEEELQGFNTWTASTIFF